MNILLLIAFAVSAASLLKDILKGFYANKISIYYGIILCIISAIPVLANLLFFFTRKCSHWKIIKIGLMKIIYLDLFEDIKNKRILKGNWIFCSGLEKELCYNGQNTFKIESETSDTDSGNPFQELIYPIGSGISDLRLKISGSKAEVDFEPLNFLNNSVITGEYTNFVILLPDLSFNMYNGDDYIGTVQMIRNSLSNVTLTEFIDKNYEKIEIDFFLHMTEDDIFQYQIAYLNFDIEVSLRVKGWNHKDNLLKYHFKLNENNLTCCLNYLANIKVNGFVISGNSKVKHILHPLEVMKSLTEGTGRLRFKRMVVDQDVTFEGLEIMSKLDVDEPDLVPDSSGNMSDEIDAIQNRIFYSSKLTNRYGPHLSSFIIDYTIEFFGFLNRKALDYCIYKSSCRGYYRISKNWQAKRFCVDFNYILEKSGLPRFTSMDSSINPTRRILKYKDTIPKAGFKEEREVEKMSLGRVACQSEEKLRELKSSSESLNAADRKRLKPFLEDLKKECKLLMKEVTGLPIKSSKDKIIVANIKKLNSMKVNETADICHTGISVKDEYKPKPCSYKEALETEVNEKSRIESSEFVVKLAKSNLLKGSGFQESYKKTLSFLDDIKESERSYRDDTMRKPVSFPSKPRAYQAKLKHQGKLYEPKPDFNVSIRNIYQVLQDSKELFESELSRVDPKNDINYEHNFKKAVAVLSKDTMDLRRRNCKNNHTLKAIFGLAKTSKFVRNQWTLDKTIKDVPRVAWRLDNYFNLDHDFVNEEIFKMLMVKVAGITTSFKPNRKVKLEKSEAKKRIDKEKWEAELKFRYETAHMDKYVRKRLRASMKSKIVEITDIGKGRKRLGPDLQADNGSKRLNIHYNKVLMGEKKVHLKFKVNKQRCPGSFFRKYLLRKRKLDEKKKLDCKTYLEGIKNKQCCKPKEEVEDKSKGITDVIGLGGKLDLEVKNTNVLEECKDVRDKSIIALSSDPNYNKEKTRMKKILNGNIENGGLKPLDLEHYKKFSNWKRAKQLSFPILFKCTLSLNEEETYTLDHTLCADLMKLLCSNPHETQLICLISS